jgi:nickel-dependent lactate racemase
VQAKGTIVDHRNAVQAKGTIFIGMQCKPKDSVIGMQCKPKDNCYHRNAVQAKGTVDHRNAVQAKGQLFNFVI